LFVPAAGGARVVDAGQALLLRLGVLAEVGDDHAQVVRGELDCVVAITLGLP